MYILRKTAYAIEKIRGIYIYSYQSFGQRVADQYIADLDHAMEKIEKNPNIGKIRPDISGIYKIYSVREHYIVYQVIDHDIFIVTLENQRRDMPNLLADLEMDFQKEIEKIKT